jgi:hypothetical protein
VRIKKRNMFSDHFIIIILIIIIYFCFSVTPLFFSYHVWISLSATLAAFFFPPYPASFGFILFGLFHTRMLVVTIFRFYISILQLYNNEFISACVGTYHFFVECSVLQIHLSFLHYLQLYFIIYKCVCRYISFLC